MNVETLFYQWADRCRRLARLAREDVERAAYYEAVTDPDATIRLVRQETKQRKDS